MYILKCIWGGKTVNCSDIFSIVATDAGLCCSFNLSPPKLKSNLGNQDFAFNLEDDEDDGVEVVDHYDYYEEGDKDDEDDFVCPILPISQAAWTDACELANDIASNMTKLQSSQTTVQPQVNKVIRKVPGSGQNKGLTVLLDTLACEKLSTQYFNGLKVKWTYNSAMYMARQIKVFM